MGNLTEPPSPCGKCGPCLGARIIDLEVTIGGLNLELIEAKEHFSIKVNTEKVLVDKGEWQNTKKLMGEYYDDWAKADAVKTNLEEAIKRLRGVLEDVLEEYEHNRSTILGTRGIYKTVKAVLEAKP